MKVCVCFRCSLQQWHVQSSQSFSSSVRLFLCLLQLSFEALSICITVNLDTNSGHIFSILFLHVLNDMVLSAMVAELVLRSLSLKDHKPSEKTLMLLFDTLRN